MQYVRDCLKVLRRGANLDNITHGALWDCDEGCKYTYVHDTKLGSPQHLASSNHVTGSNHREYDRSELLSKEDVSLGWYKRLWDTYEKAVRFPPMPKPTVTDHCDQNDPRIFHMFWQGPFTDKPYMAVLSFLYTQNLGLHLSPTDPEYRSSPSSSCRPKLWMWMKQREWSAYAPAEMEAAMVRELKKNVWAAPFLHPRFKDVIEFKVYDGVAQFDATPELHHEWGTKQRRAFEDAALQAEEEKEPISRSNTTSIGLRAARSSSSEIDYDRASVEESDLVRFILCHRYGGIYLDVDVLFLRDWEELWGWQGAFAYRWSRLDRYNTAVLRLHRQSALGTFLLRTGYRNGMNFHPASISRYMQDAQMKSLLLQAPVALFDPAWLDVEEFERDRPPQPHFTRSVRHRTEKNKECQLI